MKNKIAIIIAVFGLLVIGCKEKGSYSKMDTPTNTSSDDLHKVVVKEVVDAGTYAYLNVTEDGNEYWMAIPNIPVTIGNTYYYNGGMVMEDFISKQLDKTFDFITFAEGIRETEMAAAVTNEHVHSQEPGVTEELVPMEKIEKAKNGISLEELFTQQKSLSKKSIIVRGKVIKVNNGIMDKNWVHIEDGTQLNGERDLTITTQEIVKEGDIVTFKGNVVLNKDFGAGYVYDLIIEEGVLVK
ncbi:MAG: hypothetical protein KBE41_12260 [Lutibacter sp.]|nr:hypothetical protein [Lutibacter sp.]MBP9602268.1 hypothetical protein [Lutibacter sp.]